MAGRPLVTESGVAHKQFVIFSSPSFLICMLKPDSCKVVILSLESFVIMFQNLSKKYLKLNYFFFKK